MKKVVVLPLLLLLIFSSLHFVTTSSQAKSEDPELWKVLKPLTTTTSFLNTGAHPDDERSHLLAYLSLGEGVRTGSLIANRGEGGQNEIGLELGNGLGIIRSEELIEASDITNVDLILLSEDIDDPIYDFGFSKSVEETLNEWSEDIVYERLIRHIREYRPEIVFPSFRDVPSQHGHHRAINVLTMRAFDDAANPDVFPEHLEEGLETWQIKKLYLPAENKESATVSIEVGNTIDPVYGKTYAQLGEDSRYLHKSQGMGRDLPVEPLYVDLELVQSIQEIPEQEESIFDGLYKDFEEVVDGLKGHENQIRGALKNVQKSLDKVVAEYPDRQNVLIASHKALEELEKAYKKIEKSKINETFKADLLFKIEKKEQQLFEVSNVASSLQIDVELENVQLTRGGETEATITVKNNGQEKIDSLQLQLLVPNNWEVVGGAKDRTLKPNGELEVKFQVKVPEDAPFYHPYKESVIKAEAIYKVGKTSASLQKEPNEVVAILPDVSVDFSPRQLSINLLDPPEVITVQMELTNHLPGKSKAYPSLQLPEGWHSTTDQEFVQFEEQGEKKQVEFDVFPSSAIPNQFEVLGEVEVDGRLYSTTVQTINYDHINTSYYLFDSSSNGVAFELEIPEQLKVGYIDSGFDQIADHLMNIGLDVTKISNEELSSGNLNHYDTIALGIRAYRDPELRENNDHLLDFVENGGHLIVQYHTINDGFSESMAPYPLTIGRPSIDWRVTDQDAEVTLFNPEHSIYHFPNELSNVDWQDWVQERGLYFPSAWSDEYDTFLSMADPNEEPFDSGILMAEYGEGTYMYTNLVWYRQIQGQVPGGYRIFTNLLSYPLSQ